MEEKNINSNNEASNDTNDILSDEKMLELFEDVIDGPEKEFFKLAIGVDGKWYPSDACLKENIEDCFSGLKEINSLNVKRYTYRNDKNKYSHVGVIAQELIQIFPNSVKKDKNGKYIINTEEIFFSMINSIKELSTEVNNLKNEINRIKKN